MLPERTAEPDEVSGGEALVGGLAEGLSPAESLSAGPFLADVSSSDRRPDTLAGPGGPRLRGLGLAVLGLAVLGLAVLGLAVLGPGGAGFGVLGLAVLGLGGLGLGGLGLRSAGFGRLGLGGARLGGLGLGDPVRHRGRLARGDG